MNIRFLTAVAATALMSVPSLASASDQGWYVRGNVGYGIQTDVDFGRSLVGDVEGEGNAAGSLGLGYAFGNNWRIEVDAAQLWNDLGAVSQAGGTSAKLRTTTGMLNAIYDFDDFGSWQPYIGAGVGIANNKLDAYTTTANPTVCPGFNVTNCRFSDKDSGFSWQLLAGLGYKLSDQLTWDTQYRYQTSAGEREFVGNGLGGASGAVPIGLETHADGLGSHAVMTGFRYNFGAPARKTVGYAPLPALYTCWDGSTVGSMANCPVEPVRITCWDGQIVDDAANCRAEPQTVVQAPTIQCWDGTLVYDASSCPIQRQVSVCDSGATSFVVYFPWDESYLTDQAKAVVANATNTASLCGVSNILIEGHADSSGNAQYNVGLSNRRANAVEAEMKTNGLSTTNVTKSAKGESELAIPTGDNVREPLNRRSEVIISLIPENYLTR